MAPRPLRILIVDDEPNILHMLSEILTQDGFDPVSASDADQALEILKRESFDFILSDVRMPGMDGIALLNEIRQKGVEAMVILMSAYGSVDLAMEAMRKGAYDYISKPFKTDEVVLTLRKAAERERLRREVIRLKRRLQRSEGSPEVVAASPSMKSVLDTVEQIAPFDSSVLITGESGTGKEVVARYLHSRSPRADSGFVPINCAALPEGLLESELFGHARGAFTGATSAKAGLFEEADGGALFLDEIGGMQPSLQAKLLRALDTGEIRRVGENVQRRFSVRIIAATNEDLESAISRGDFREDLFYRISVAPIHLAPLRERREDILPLVERFVGIFNEKLKRKVRHISREAGEALLNCPWKGNVREIQNVIERAMIVCAGDSIDLDSLPADIRSSAADLVRIEEPESSLSLKQASRNLEKSLIAKALNRTGGNRKRAAELLELSYPSLLSKIKEYGLK